MITLADLCNFYSEESYDPPFLSGSDFEIQEIEGFSHYYDRLTPIARWRGLCKLMRAMRETEACLSESEVEREPEFSDPPSLCSPEHWTVLLKEFDLLSREMGCHISAGQLALPMEVAA